jgi:ankyrin repeat protein
VEGNSEEAIKCVKFLLAADESQKNAPCKSTRHFLQRNQTPLHIAAEEKSWNMVRYLLEIGCDCSAVDSDGRTPLHVAVTA